MCRRWPFAFEGYQISNLIFMLVDVNIPEEGHHWEETSSEHDELARRTA